MLSLNDNSNRRGFLVRMKGLLLLAVAATLVTSCSRWESEHQSDFKGRKWTMLWDTQEENGQDQFVVGSLTYGNGTVADTIQIDQVDENGDVVQTNSVSGQEGLTVDIHPDTTSMTIYGDGSGGAGVYFQTPIVQ